MEKAQELAILGDALDLAGYEHRVRDLQLVYGETRS